MVKKKYCGIHFLKNNSFDENEIIFAISCSTGRFHRYEFHLHKFWINEKRCPYDNDRLLNRKMKRKMQNILFEIKFLRIRFEYIIKMKWSSKKWNYHAFYWIISIRFGCVATVLQWHRYNETLHLSYCNIWKHKIILISCKWIQTWHKIFIPWKIFK
jgi:hypothetical protein